MIHERNQEAAAKAADERREPFVVEEADVDRWKALVAAGLPPKLPFPDLGDYTPDGWEELEEFFVDSTGWDLHDAGGPAMSVAELVDALEPGFGYGITSVGQFQVYIAKFVEAH
jgi:hypothetical protein